jgi:hypothetical protein
MFRLLRFFVFLLLLAGGGVLLLGATFLQEHPAVAAMQPPGPEDVRAARNFYKEVQAATSGRPDAPETVMLSADTLTSVLRLGARLVRDYRAETEVAEGTVRMTAALPVPWFGGTRWLNLRAAVAPFEERFALHRVQLGEREVSPDLALRLARLGANVVIGTGAGDRLIDAPSAMAIDGDRMVFALRLDRDGRGEVLQGVFGALRGSGMPAPDRVEHHYVALRTAMDRLEVPVAGSFVPLLRLTLQNAYEQAEPETAADEFAAAVIALAKACGAADFWMVFGSAAGRPSAELGRWRTDCRRLTLARRIDLRRHFITAAAIKAASNRGFAVSMGEFKELHDTIKAGGFDFTDIVANNSGIRMADLFLSRPHSEWPDLLDRMQAEEDFLPSLEGIPGRMRGDRFSEQFGDIDSPAYRDLMDHIEERIGRTRLHMPGVGGGG